MITLDLRVMFENYIAHPYWPEKNTVIEVEKKSGMNRCKSDKTRDQALNAQLKKMDLSMALAETKLMTLALAMTKT